MDLEYYVTLSDIVEDLGLTALCCEDRLDEIKVQTPDLNRPGLPLAGFTKDFSKDRIQILGNVETRYLLSIPEEERKEKLDKYFSFEFPCMIVCRNLEVLPEVIDTAKKYGVPVFRTEKVTTEAYSNISRYLMVRLAPRESIHGCLIEIYGEGVLILGKSGAGKSETALELVKRGHKLVADDVVEVRKVSDSTLVGAAPQKIRHLIEIRGVGLMDVRRLFGVGSVKITESISLVVNLEPWDESKDYDRIGATEQHTDILGIDVPSVTVPVMPGRNLAIILEVAAINNRQKQMGYNTAAEIIKRAFESKEHSDPARDYSGDFFIKGSNLR